MKASTYPISTCYEPFAVTVQQSCNVEVRNRSQEQSGLRGSRFTVAEKGHNIVAKEKY